MAKDPDSKRSALVRPDALGWTETVTSERFAAVIRAPRSMTHAIAGIALLLDVGATYSVVRALAKHPFSSGISALTMIGPFAWALTGVVITYLAVLTFTSTRFVFEQATFRARTGPFGIGRTRSFAISEIESFATVPRSITKMPQIDVVVRIGTGDPPHIFRAADPASTTFIAARLNQVLADKKR